VRDVDGFDEFYRASRQRLLGYMYVVTGDVAEAQDAVQDAYVRAWQRWSTVSQYQDPESWVRLVAAGAPEGTVKARLSRGRAALAGLLTVDLEGARDA
jgi:DNA-directed RNA polymerase specialized sigma24 family protein